MARDRSRAALRAKSLSVREEANFVGAPAPSPTRAGARVEVVAIEPEHERAVRSHCALPGSVRTGRRKFSGAVFRQPAHEIRNRGSKVVA